MISRKMNTTKFIMLIGFPLIVLCIIVQTFGESDKLSISTDLIVNNTATNSIKNNPTLRDSIIEYGMEFLGTPYVAGGCSKDGFDCSGYVYFVFQHFKIQVPRSSIQFKNFGKEVPIENIKKGDILLFLSPTRNVIGHLGIITNPNGKDSEFIHSTSGRDMKVVISSLKTKGYADRFVKAVNVLGSYEAEMPKR